MSNTYALRIGGHTAGGNFFENVTHFELAETGAGTTPFQYAVSFLVAWNAANLGPLLDCLSMDTTIDFIAARRITGGGGQEALLPIAQAGTINLRSVSSGVAANIQLVTPSPTNRFGHLYLTGFPESYAQDDVIAAALITLIDTLSTAWSTALVLSGGLGTAAWVVFSKKLAAAYPVTSTLVAVAISYFNQRKKPLV